MKEEELNKRQAIETKFAGPVTFNGPMFDIHDNQHVETHVHYENGGTSHLVLPSEPKIKEALEKLLEARDDKGEKIFRWSYQWYAVMKVLGEGYEYPKGAEKFALSMKKLLGDDITPKCAAESFRKEAIGPAGKLLKVWRQEGAEVGTHFYHLRIVAFRLMEYLKEG